MTKEELLQKGISDDVANEIIASFSETSQDEVTPLEALQKALKEDDPEMENLSKAEKGEDDSEEGKEEYDEKFMKKMKRYMKENGKMFKEEKEDMKKAIDEFDSDAEGAVIEMSDLAPILERQSEFNEKMSKAISDLAESIVFISEKTEKNYDLMQKAARVTALQAESLGDFLKTPEGRKGVVASAEMSKAKETAVAQNKIVYDALKKATLNKDRTAGYIISAFESAGKNFNALNKSQKAYVNELIQKEAN